MSPAWELCCAVVASHSCTENPYSAFPVRIYNKLLELCKFMSIPQYSRMFN